MAQAGRLAEIRELRAPRLRRMVSAEALQVAWEAETGRRAPVTSIGEPASEPASAGVVRVPVTELFRARRSTRK